MRNEYNYKHIQLSCPECKHQEILIDNHRQETYCTHCGLILQDNTLFKITLAIEEETRKIKYIRDLWRK